MFHRLSRLGVKVRFEDRVEADGTTKLARVEHGVPTRVSITSHPNMNVGLQANNQPRRAFESKKSVLLRRSFGS
jgi:hypothetical protein